MADDSVDEEDYEDYLFGDFSDDGDDFWNKCFRFYDNYVKFC